MGFKYRFSFVLVLFLMIVSLFGFFVQSSEGNSDSSQQDFMILRFEPEFFSAESDTIMNFIVPESGALKIDVSNLELEHRNKLSEALVGYLPSGDLSGGIISLNSVPQGRAQIKSIQGRVYFSFSSSNYIVEFKEPPLLLREAGELDRTAFGQLDSSQESSLLEEKQTEHIEQINEFLMGKNTLTGRVIYNVKKITGMAVENEIEVGERFSGLVNAVVLKNLDETSAEKIKKLDFVENVYEDRFISIGLMDSVPMIGADISHRNGINGRGMKIAIVDTGVDYTHPDLGGCFGANCKVSKGYDFVNNDADPMDDHGHGTHCAATAAGNAGLGGLDGVAPEAEVYAYKVLSSGGSGSFSTVIKGIETAVIDGADVISMSLGATCSSYSTDCGPDDIASKAVDRAVDSGVVVVVAAGNSGPNEGTIGSPGTARKALTVGAVNKNREMASFSSRGPVKISNEIIFKPDVVSPGVSICAAQWATAWEANSCFDDKHVAISGTSMATPHVAGLAALVKQKNSFLNPEQIKEYLKSNTEDLGFNMNDQGTGLVRGVVGQVEVSLSGNFDFGRFLEGDGSKTKIISIKNLGKSEKTFYLSLEENFENKLSIDTSSFSLAPGESKNLSASLDGSHYSQIGYFSSKILIQDDSGTQYPMRITFSKVIELSIKMNGNHYPDIYIQDNSQKGDWQSYLDYVGGVDDVAKFYLTGGSKTVHLISDFVISGNEFKYPETANYFLSKSITVSESGNMELIFDLESPDVKKITVSAKSMDSQPLSIYHLERALMSYRDKFYRDGSNSLFHIQYFSSSSGGDLDFYVTESPDNGLNTDLLIKYMGAA